MFCEYIKKKEGTDYENAFGNTFSNTVKRSSSSILEPDIAPVDLKFYKGLDDDITNKYFSTYLYLREKHGNN